MDHADRSHIVPVVDHVMLNDAQRQAVAHRGGPLLVLAGPGSGKTRMLIHRIAALAAETQRPDRIVAVSFTNKAATELRERLGRMIGDEAATRVQASTFHAFCLALLRRHHDEVGLPRWFSVLDVADAEKLLRQQLVELGGDAGDARAFAARISYAKNTGMDGAALAATPQGELLHETLEAYTKRCRELGVVDFDDLLCHARMVLRGPSAPEVVARYDSIVVDEWQDTNQVQYDIVAALAGATPASRDVCVVGDPMQSIYSWRGSSSVVTERFIAEFAPTVVELGENYRSSAKIVAVADAVAAGAGGVRRARLHTKNPPGEQPQLWECVDPDDEARRVVAALKGQVVGRRNRDGSRRTAAVLVRTNAQTRVFETALSLAGIAHQLVGTVRFVDRAEVKDALAYLKVVVNPADRIAFARAANTPRRKLGDVSLNAFFAACDAGGVLPGAAVFDEAFRAGCKPALARALTVFAEDLAPVAAAVAEGSVADSVRAVLDAGLREFHSAEPERVENLDELLVAAAAFTAADGETGAGRIEAFVQTMALTGASDVAEPNQVSVITAHASKGREFDHVFVVGAEDDIIPHALARTVAEREEERRLFFVAVSRARTELVIAHRQRHFLNGEWRNAVRSPFLNDIEHLCRVDRVPVSRAGVRPPSRAGSYRGGPYRAGRHRVPSSTATVAAGLPPRRHATPDPGPRLVAQDARPGLHVTHTHFGAGVVVAVAGSLAKIDFAGKVRDLDLGFAPLTVVEPETD